MHTAEAVREILLSQWPGRFEPGQLRDDVSLGEDGLGLDSIEIVELLLACEEQLEGPVTEELLAEGAIDIGALVAHFSAG
jgi:acyl carrier protein